MPFVCTLLIVEKIGITFTFIAAWGAWGMSSCVRVVRQAASPGCAMIRCLLWQTAVVIIASDIFSPLKLGRGSLINAYAVHQVRGILDSRELTLLGPMYDLSFIHI